MPGVGLHTPPPPTHTPTLATLAVSTADTVDGFLVDPRVCKGPSVMSPQPHHQSELGNEVDFVHIYGTLNPLQRTSRQIFMEGSENSQA